MRNNSGLLQQLLLIVIFCVCFSFSAQSQLQHIVISGRSESYTAYTDEYTFNSDGTLHSITNRSNDKSSKQQETFYTYRGRATQFEKFHYKTYPIGQDTTVHQLWLRVVSPGGYAIIGKDKATGEVVSQYIYRLDSLSRIISLHTSEYPSRPRSEYNTAKEYEYNYSTPGQVTIQETIFEDEEYLVTVADKLITLEGISSDPWGKFVFPVFTTYTFNNGQQLKGVTNLDRNATTHIKYSYKKDGMLSIINHKVVRPTQNPRYILSKNSKIKTHQLIWQLDKKVKYPAGLDFTTKVSRRLIGMIDYANNSHLFTKLFPDQFGRINILQEWLAPQN